MLDDILHQRWVIEATIPALDGLKVEEEITDFKYTKFYNPDGNPTIGSTCAACIEFTLNGKNGYLNNILDFRYGMVKGDEGELTIWGKIGRFKVMECERDKDGLFVKCKAFDAMIYKFEKPYIDNSWTDSSFDEEFGDLGGATPRIILDHIKSQTNMQINVTGLLHTFPILPTGTDDNKKAIWNYNCITPRPRGYTYRQMLGYIASLAGTCATVGTDNVLYFKWYSDEQNEINAIGSDRLYMDSNDNDEETEFKTGYLKCVSKKTKTDKTAYELTFQKGDGAKGDGTVAFENPYMTEPIMNGLAALENEWKLLGFASRKMTFRFVGDFRLEVGQTLCVTTKYGKSYKIPIMQITHEWDGGLITEITSTCETKSQGEISTTGPISESIERNYQTILNSTIPNNGELKIQKNGEEIGKFTANQSENSTINITTVAKIKGDNEIDYRTGEVNLTPADIGAFKKLTAKKTISSAGWYRFLQKNKPYFSCLIFIKRVYSNNEPEQYLIEVEVNHNSISVVQLNSLVQVSLISKVRIAYQVDGTYYIDFYYKGNESNGVTIDVLYTRAIYENSDASMVDFVKNPNITGYNIYEYQTSSTQIVGNIKGNATSADFAINSDTVDGKHASDLQNYNNLVNKPAIPVVNNGTVTIKQNGVNKGSFTMNQSGNTAIELTDTNTQTITGVKGNAENTYRTGNINLTPANIGLGNVDNTHDKDKNVASATKATQDGNGNNIVSTYVKKSGDTMSGTLSSSKVTNTYLAGNQGQAIINSTASGGSYTVLDKLNSTNGYFTDGVYQGRREFHYTDKNVVDAETNNITKNLVLLDESGNSSFPGNFETYGCVHTMPNHYGGRIQAGDKVKMWTDSEGGNIQINSNNFNMSNGAYYQIDAHNGVLRAYYGDNSVENPHSVSFNASGVLSVTGGFRGNTLNGYNIGGSVTSNNNGLVTGGNVYSTIGHIQITDIKISGVVKSGSTIPSGASYVFKNVLPAYADGASYKVIIPQRTAYCVILDHIVSNGGIDVTVLNVSGATHTLSVEIAALYYKTI